MSNDFKISEFLIDKTEQLKYEIADKILTKHIAIIQPIRDIMMTPIWPSENSGYRSIYWEKQHGRSGYSEHCFRGDGAVDYACDITRLHELFEHLKHSGYNRICLYDTFIHCDHKGNERQAFKCVDGVNWVRI